MSSTELDQYKEVEKSKNQLSEKVKKIINSIDKALSFKHPVGFTLFTSFVFILGSLCSDLKYGEQRRNTLNNITHQPEGKIKPVYRLYPTHNVSDDFDNLQMVLNRLGYNQESNSLNDWDLLWATKFTNLHENLDDLESHQKVNHFAGSGNITNKKNLSLMKSRYIPKSFHLPEQLKELQEYAQNHSNLLFVERNSKRKGASVKSIKEFVSDDSETFVQKYVSDPLLWNGYKFDIGVYAIITSVNPLRVYIYNGDFLITKCTAKYHPFDPLKTNKYLKPDGDVSLPEDKARPLSLYYTTFGHGMREGVKSYFKRKGITLMKVWLQIEQAIAEIFVKNEINLIYMVLGKYKTTRHFFELIRFDFIIDNKLNVYLLKAKAHPEGFSGTIRRDSVFCDQLLYSVLNLVGIGKLITKSSLRIRSQNEELMQSAERNIMVNGNICITNECIASCNLTKCLLCRSCLEPSMMTQLHDAYREHVNRIECKRVFPPTMTGDDLSEEYLKQFSLQNQLMLTWFNAKCKNNKAWC